MRMRTIPEAIKLIQKDDPGTRLTAPLLRRMVKNGVVPVVQVANRQYIDLDRLSYYLAGERIKSTQPEMTTGFIRPIKE